MRRLIAVVALLALVVLAAPASAQTADVLQPCTNAGTAVVVTPEGLETDIATPTQPLWGVTGEPGTEKTFILDLAGNALTDNKAVVEVALSWDVPVEDYDLSLYDSSGTEVSHSENIQPVETGEVVSGEIGHCKKFTAEALNWVAAGASKLALGITVG